MEGGGWDDDNNNMAMAILCKETCTSFRPNRWTRTWSWMRRWLMQGLYSWPGKHTSSAVSYDDTSTTVFLFLFSLLSFSLCTVFPPFFLTQICKFYGENVHKFVNKTSHFGSWMRPTSLFLQGLDQKPDPVMRVSSWLYPTLSAHRINDVLEYCNKATPTS